MTEQQVYCLEHEMRRWHAQSRRTSAPRPKPVRHGLAPLLAPLRRFWLRRIGSAEHAEMLRVLRLELLRAVGSGELSHETAHWLLSAPPYPAEMYTPGG